MNRIVLAPLAAIAVCQPAQATVYLTVEQAQKLLFAGQELTPLPVVLSGADMAAIEKDSGVKVFAGSLRAWKAPDGYLFIDSVIGKHDLITYAVALTGAGKVREIEIMEYREVYGGEVRSARWLAQFAGKQHGDALRPARDIPNISGATLSCEHVTEGIRRLLSTYAVAIAGRDP
jgi:FMN-binding domain